MSRDTTPRQRRARTVSTEIYCRRDNRVYDSCPYAAGGNACPCVQGMETADSLFEIGGTDSRRSEDREQ
jgi:hypothetical protein